MRILVFVAFLALSPALSSQLRRHEKKPIGHSIRTPPKLVVAIIIDQFRYDYVTRWWSSDCRGKEHFGIERLLCDGASFTNARYPHSMTVTAVGHSTFLSGATPANSGIIGNEWWDNQTGRKVTSVFDPAEHVIDEDPSALSCPKAADDPKPECVGASPRRMQQSTLGDELKMFAKTSKVIGVSLKDRGAILPVGHLADAAYWLWTREDSNGEDIKNSINFVTSSYYANKLPQWVVNFRLQLQQKKNVRGWPSNGPNWMKHDRPAIGGDCQDLEYGPLGNELVEQFAKAAVDGESLGTAGRMTDLLTISFSATDYVGHCYGPDSEEVHTMAVDVEERIGSIIDKVYKDTKGDVVVVLTSDHGVAPRPEKDPDMRGGRLNQNDMKQYLETLLDRRFGGANWVNYCTEYGVYLNSATASERGTSMAHAENVAAAALRQWPGVFRVYTRTQLINGWISADEVGIRVRNSFHQERSGNLLVIPQPYWFFSEEPKDRFGRPNPDANATTHGTPFDYDTHVPLFFWGPRFIKGGTYPMPVVPNDIAPTLAALLGIGTPSGSVGRVLTEILK